MDRLNAERSNTSKLGKARPTMMQLPIATNGGGATYSKSDLEPSAGFEGTQSKKGRSGKPGIRVVSKRGASSVSRQVKHSVHQSGVGNARDQGDQWVIGPTDGQWIITPDETDPASDSRPKGRSSAVHGNSRSRVTVKKHSKNKQRPAGKAPARTSARPSQQSASKGSRKHASGWKAASAWKQMPLILVLAAGTIFLCSALYSSKPQATKTVAKPLAPLVEVHELVNTDIPVTVYAQGVAMPALSIPLVSEVSGRVKWVSKQFENGGAFREGDVMVEIERGQYELDVARARSALANAEQRLLRARSEMEARQGVEGLDTNDLGTGRAQVVQAQANVEAAKAELNVAEVRLSRTQIHAPFTGLVQEKRIGVGQVVSAGTKIGQMYSAGDMEVRLPLTDVQRQQLTLPVHGDDDGPSVVFRARTGDAFHEWHGRIVRTESQLNQRNRMLNVVARVGPPAVTDQNLERLPPLTAGTFLEATIAGETLKDVWVIPRAAMRADGVVWLVQADDRLHRRVVDPIHSDDTHIYVRGDFGALSHVVTSTLDYAVEGMAARVMDARQSLGALANGRSGSPAS